MSLRLGLRLPSPPRPSSAALLSSENMSPLQGSRSAASATSPQAAHSAPPRKAVYVQEEEEEEARRRQRTPIRRSKTNFLIPVYSSEEAEDD